MNKIYFPNLNGLRFIAALLVIIHHVEQLKGVFGLPYFDNTFVLMIGKLGVILFFVLSGFLINNGFKFFKQKHTMLLLG